MSQFCSSSTERRSHLGETTPAVCRIKLLRAPLASTVHGLSSALLLLMLLLLLRCAGILSIPFWIKSGSEPGVIEFSRLRALVLQLCRKVKTPRPRDVALDEFILLGGRGDAETFGASGRSGDRTAGNEWSHCACE